MNNITIFNNPEFGDIRTEVVDGEPWFCLSDVCKALLINNPSQIKTRLNEAGIITNEVGVRTGLKSDGTPSIQKMAMLFINESNLYKTIFQSRKESAERFTDWVTSEVLPSIRKTGSYSIDKCKPDSYMIEDPIERAKRWIEEQEEKQKLIETVQEQAPKAEYFDSLVNSNLLTNFRDTAKELGYSQTEFTGWLIAKGYVYKDSKGILKPYETYRKQGLFQMKDFKNPYNHFTGARTFVTVKGKNTFRLLMQVPD